MFLRYLPRSFKKNQGPSSEIILKYGKGTFIKDCWYGKLNKSFYLAYSLIQDPPSPSVDLSRTPMFYQKKMRAPYFLFHLLPPALPT